MITRIKILGLMICLALFGGLLMVAGCGEEKTVTESQAADYNKPGVVYVVTTYSADVSIPVLDISTDALVAYLANEIVAGRLNRNDDTAISLAAISELLAHPKLYYIPSGATDTRSMEVNSSGNGFIVSPDGYLVTNAHLVKKSKDDLKLSMAEEAAANAITDELTALETGLGFQLSQDEADNFMAAGLSIYADYLTVSDTTSKTQVYPGYMIQKARDEEKGLGAETVKVGDPIDMKEETGKDIAILKVNASNLPTVKLGDESSVRDGDKVTAVGFLDAKSSESGDTSTAGPKEDKPTLVSGTIAGHRTMGDGWTVLQMQIPLKQGSSGSPILNSNGEVVGVETFGNVETDQTTGAQTNIDTENFAIPVSIVKEFLSQSNVTAAQGNPETLYREGVDLFYQQHYSAAKQKFEDVKSASSDFPYIQSFISDSQDNINKGLDKGTFPTAIVLIVVGVVVVALVVILLLVLLLKSRSKKNQPGPGAPAVAAPVPPAPTPAPVAPAPAPEAPAPPAAPPAPSEEPTVTMPPPAAPQVPTPPPAATPPPSETPPPAPQGPMPGSPEDTGGPGKK